MDLDVLEMTRGDARTIRIGLTREAVAWPVPDGTTLRATGKLALRDDDDSAVWAKTSDAGISVDPDSDDDAVLVELDPEDTDDIAANGTRTTLWCDVQATGTNWGPWTVARFLLRVNPDVSRTAP